MIAAAIVLHPYGVAIALGIVVLIAGTLYWMMHPPSTRAERVARASAAESCPGKESAQA